MKASKSSIESDLRKWHGEATALGIGQDRLWAFLAQRLVDSGVLAIDEEWNVVRAQIGAMGIYRKVRIDGRRGKTGWLDYTSTDSSGFGIIPIAYVHPEDNRKLADILDRLEGVKA
jgi:hypothetical protein